MKTTPALLEHREFADVDRHFAKLIGGFGGPELTAVASAALSRNLRFGHICLDLAAGPADLGDAGMDFAWPALETWEAALKKNRAAGGPDDGRPLVLDAAGRLYLRRYWEYEKSLAKAILSRCGEHAGVETDDLHQLAIETALARRFLVISGGPGTGKTTTVLKILERMITQPGNGRLRIALAAPTGKAAARLEESLRAGNSDLRDRLPKSASTLHRLLGSRPDSAFFRHNAGNPLPVDVVVVDEASMVPLTMMAKLFDALPEKARVILLGDPHQLASVEPGYVLGDIAAAASAPGSPLHGSLVGLQKNYRFGNRSAIFALSNAVREGDAARVFEILGEGEKPDLIASMTPPVSRLTGELRARVVAGYSAFLKENDPGAALKKFQQFRILCALRSGPYGVENVNRRIEAILREEGLIPDALPARGMPVLITRNDYQMRLFNGDIGLIFPDESGLLQAWFMDEGDNLRHFEPARLPEHESAFAMTVHKSQGSEYDDLLLVLPDRPSPVCTRELVYTGLTRARNKVEFWYREAVLRAAIETPARRASGLRERLGGGN